MSRRPSLKQRTADNLSKHYRGSARKRSTVAHKELAEWQEIQTQSPYSPGPRHYPAPSTSKHPMVRRFQQVNAAIFVLLFALPLLFRPMQVAIAFFVQSTLLIRIGIVATIGVFVLVLVLVLTKKRKWTQN